MGSIKRSRAMLKRLASSCAATFLLFSVTACTPQEDNPDIIVTTNILGDVVTRLVGEEADVYVLMKSNADPHSFGISAQEAGAMEQADLIVANGLGLEEGLISNLDNARSQGVPVLEVGEQLNPIDYSPGTPDPHFWTDPERMITATHIIEEALIAELERSQAEAIATSAESYRHQLKDMDADVAELLNAVPGADRKLVTNHHVFGYLAERFDYSVIGTIIPGGTTLAAPSAGDLHDISQTIVDHQVPAIFTDSSQPQRLAEVLAAEAGIQVQVVPLFTESLTEPDGDAGSYIDMQHTNAQRIFAALS